MGIGTWEWIHTLVAVMDTGCMFSSQLYTFYLTTVLVDFLNSMSKKQCVWVLQFCLLWDRHKLLEGEENCSSSGSAEHPRKGELSPAQAVKANKHGVCSTSAVQTSRKLGATGSCLTVEAKHQKWWKEHSSRHSQKAGISFNPKSCWANEQYIG